MITPFEGKAAVYHKYRADYSPEAIAALLTRAHLHRTQRVADLGAGTGLLTRHLIAHARTVFAIEPASDMRHVVEQLDVMAIDGTAETTKLDDASIDVITCGNAFHYFDPDRTRDEASRILRGHRRVVILFHDAPDDATPFMSEYADFLQRHTPPQLAAVHSPDDHETRIARFFDGRKITIDKGEQREQLSYDRLRGRYLSSSLADERALDELRALFEGHQRDGAVTLNLIWKCIACDSF